MTEQVWLQLIAGVVAIFFGWFKLRQIELGVDNVHLAVNSRLDQLLEVTKQMARKEGAQDADDARALADQGKADTRAVIVKDALDARAVLLADAIKANALREGAK